MTFAAAKVAALEALDSCPIEVIRWFINRSWRFMSAYRTGLTGKAAAWAVKKQRSHCSVPERARLAIEPAELVTRSRPPLPTNFGCLRSFPIAHNVARLELYSRNCQNHQKTIPLEKLRNMNKLAINM